MPESFAALDSEEWDSWIAHFDDCAVINGWNAGKKSSVSCSPNARGSSAPVREYSGGRAGVIMTILKRPFVRNVSLRNLGASQSKVSGAASRKGRETA